MSRFTNFPAENKSVKLELDSFSDLPLVTLKKALEPIEPYIDRVQDHGRVAWEQCTYPSEHNLTREESAAIYLYSMETKPNSFFLLFNRVLRSGNGDAIHPWRSYLKLLTKAVDKLPPVQMSVWRGGSADLFDSFKQGQQMYWSCFTSCSSSLPVTKNFLGSKGLLFMIEVVFGKDISKYAMCPDEKEVLLCPGTSLNVVSNSLQFDADHQIVHLKETTQNKNVVVIGITGPSGCSRHTYAAHLAKRLKSPFQPLLMKNFRKDKIQVKHPKLGTVLSGDMPETYDIEGFARALRLIRLNPNSSTPFLKRQKNVQIRKQIIIIVDGALTFGCTDEITSMFDIRIFIDADQAQCRLGRYRHDQRIGNNVTDESIVIPEAWQIYYDDIIWSEHSKRREEQMKKAEKIFKDSDDYEKDCKVRDTYIEQLVTKCHQ